MPISEKIIREINQLKTSNEMKELMKDILQLEDDGVKRWNKEYEAKINEYLEHTSEEE